MSFTLFPVFSFVRSSAATILLAPHLLTPATDRVIQPLALTRVTALSFALVLLICWIASRTMRR